MAGAALLLLAGDASAHADLLSTEPSPGLLDRAPATVHLRFSEAVTPVGRGIAVLSPAGRQVGSHVERPSPEEMVVSVDSSERGTYLVTWTVIASDTHPSRGSFSFSVGRADPVGPAGAIPAGEVGAVSPLGLLLQVGGRWAHLAGYALAFGSIAFALFVVGTRLQPQVAVRSRRLALVGIGLLILAEPLTVVGQVLSLGAFDGQVLADVLSSPSGRLLALRLGAALLLWAVLGAAEQTRHRAAGAGAIALGLALAGVDAASTHLIKGVPAISGLLLNALHEIAMGAWLGGLVTLAASLGVTQEGERRALVARFGRYAAVALALLILTGALLALSHLRSPMDLLRTGYGYVVVFKVAAVGAALAAAYLGVRAGRSWKAEAFALGGVLVIASLLVSLPPPR